MIFEPTNVDGAFVIRPEYIRDERGFFSRVWCKSEFAERGLNSDLVQTNLSYNERAGTLRGMHYQLAPHGEVKLVRCTVGSVYDVIIDLRRNSPTHLKHYGVVLSAENRTAFYIPEGCAHGFITLEDDTEVLYQMSQYYAPDHARGVRWNDGAFGIDWPVDVKVIKDRDHTYPDYTPAADYNG